MTAGIAGFFKTDSILGRQRQEAIRQQNELINASRGGLKRPRTEIKLEEEETPSTGLLSADVYSQPAGGASTASADSIFSSSSGGICFNSRTESSLTDRPLRPTNGQTSAGQPVRKKLKIVVKGFPTSTDVDPDENIPTDASNTVMEVKMAVAAATSTAAAVEDGAQEKAKTYVGQLKKCLTAEEFVMFRQAIKYYKTASDFAALRPVLEAVLVKYQVQQSDILTGFRVFLKKHHVEEFEAFCRQEARID
jgi:hypothetical protein